MSTHSFQVNGQTVAVDCPDDVRVLWVLRNLLGINGPKYGCGLGVCRACTCHIHDDENPADRAFNPCSVRVGDLPAGTHITTIEGLPATVGRSLHPMQEAWLACDVAQCGYCQPGQIMAAVAKVNAIYATEGRRPITDDDLDDIRNVCRCGTYVRIRQAIPLGASRM